MRKLTLDLEALDVDSFSTEAKLVHADGTVHGQDDDTAVTEFCTMEHPCTHGHACRTQGQNCQTYTCTVAPNC